MCKKENILRLQTMINRIINKIFEICEEKWIYETLSDSKLYRPAIIMHFINCEEQLNKIFMSAGHEILSIFSEQKIKGFNIIRNIGVHDYDGLNLNVIEDIIRFYLPPLKEKIENFLRNNE